MVWDSVISLQRVWSWWYSESVISKSRAFQWCIICRFTSNFYNLYMFKGLRFEMVYFHFSLSDHGDTQNLWSPSQKLSNDVSSVSWSETFIISTCLRIWGLRLHNFTWGCRIMVIFKICDLQVKSFPMM